MGASDARQVAPAVLLENCQMLEDVDRIVACNRFDTLWDFDDQWPELPCLNTAAKSGCDFCALMRKHLLSAPDIQPWPHKGPDTVHIFVRPVTDTQPPFTFESITLCGIEVMASDRKGWAREVQFVASCDFNTRAFFQALGDIAGANRADIARSLPFFSAPSNDVLSDQNIRFTREAISAHQRNCDSQYDRPQRNGFLPTRLLDLGENADMAKQIRLGFSTEIAKSWTADQILSAEYATLSYCWGTAEVACTQSKTTSSNLRERLSGIDVGALSPVIQDAIQVCLKLSIRYLWVDALCILQGEGLEEIDDWDKESQQMSRIFENALVTICAASSTSCQERFLCRSKIEPELSIRYHSKTRETGTPALMYNLAHCSENPFMPLNTNPSFGLSWALQKHSRWINRGWVHQEIALSPRLLIFTEDVVMFSSADFQACEIGWQTFQAQREPVLGRVTDGELRAHPFSNFAASVASITEKNFTKETDRLPAIAGLARRVADVTGSGYLAGLFRDHLQYDLLYYRPFSDNWECFDERYCQLSKPDSTSRPSWSWAGLPGESIPYRGFAGARMDTRTCEVIDAAVFRRDGTKFGRVHGGYLKIRVPTVSLLDWVAGDKDSAKELVTKQHDHIANFENIRWDCDNRNSWSDLIENVFLVKIQIHGRDRACGLFLYPATKHGEYYRIGYWRAYYNDTKHVKWRKRMITLV